jgi:Uma2 family endonuclease
MAFRLRYDWGEFMGSSTKKRLFNVHEYHRMVDAGILRDNDRVELIAGVVLEMSPIGPRHNAAIMRANKALNRIVHDQAILGVQGSIRLDEWNEPQPDLYLLRPKDDFYASGLANPSDVMLVVEIADSSLEYDRTVKVDLYAIAGVPEYWISNIQDEEIEAYSHIVKHSYSKVRRFKRGETVVPGLLPDCPIPVDVLLP